MRLDTTQVWRDASATIGANREVLAVLAGVFFFLPSLAVGLFLPPPEPPAGAEPKQILALMGEFYQTAAPYMLANALVQTLGQLAVLVLITRSERLTVGEALREGSSSLLPYIGAQLLVTFGTMLAVGVVLLLGGLSGSVALVIGLVAAVYIGMRFILVPPVIMIDRLRNPVEILRRSWALTQGNVGPMLLFLFLLILAMVVIGAVAGGIVGIVLALVGGAEAVRIGSAAVSALVGAGMTLVIVASFVSMHRQLAGTRPDEASAAFE